MNKTITALEKNISTFKIPINIKICKDVLITFIILLKFLKQPQNNPKILKIKKKSGQNDNRSSKFYEILTVLLTNKL